MRLRHNIVVDRTAGSHWPATTGHREGYPTLSDIPLLTELTVVSRLGNACRARPAHAASKDIGRRHRAAAAMRFNSRTTCWTASLTHIRLPRLVNSEDAMRHRSSHARD